MTGDPKIYEQIKDTKRKITELLLDENGKKKLHLKQNYYEIGSKATKLLANHLLKQQAMNTINKLETHIQYQ